MTPRILTLLAALALSGAPLCAQEAPSAEPLSADSLCASIARQVKAHFNVDGDLELHLTRAWTPGQQVASGWTAEVTDYPASLGSSMIVRCKVRAGADSEESQFVVRASLWREGWAVKMPLSVGSVFDPARLEVRRADFLREHDVVPADQGDRTYAFGRSVPVGRFLTWHDLARHPLVHKGDSVEVVASEGALTITMKAIALDSGAEGDTVSVRNPDSKKIFSALVTDEKRVQVQF